MNRTYHSYSLLSGFLVIQAAACWAQAPSTPDNARCGEVITMKTHDHSTTRYAFVPPSKTAGPGGPTTLVLLAGGSGHVDLDAQGCPSALKGNSLVRMIPVFAAAGLGTALVDAPSDLHGEDGLGGYRIAAPHAQDLGKVVADLRARTQGSVWLVGTSRGAISAANAGARLSGPSAPDGLVLTSAVTSGQRGARKAWVAQTVFDVSLEDIRLPLLVVGHAADKCLRSPANLMGKIMARIRSTRQQLVTVTGGSGHVGSPGLDACEGRAPHGFAGQESEVAAGMVRFIRGGAY